MAQNYRELQIYQEAFDLAMAIHQMTINHLPKFEMYEEGSQIRRSSKSVISNIVEGFSRKRHKNEFIQFLTYALGSCNETKEHLEMLYQSGSLKKEELYKNLSNRYELLGGKIMRFMQSLEDGHLVGKRTSNIQNLISILSLVLLISNIQNPTSIFAAFGSGSAGTSGAAFLKLGAGARPAALGEAYTAISDDANAIYWNTAGLATLKKNEFVAMRADLFQGLQYHFFAFAHPTKRWGTFGLGVNNLNVSGIEQRSADTDAAEGTVSANDSAYTLAYAHKIPLWRGVDGGRGVFIGAGAKFIRQTLAGSAANSVAVDLGSLYHFTTLPLSLGLAVQNLGSGLKFKDASDPLPLTMKLGGSYRLGESWALSGKTPSDSPLLLRENERGLREDEEESEKRSGGLLLSLDFNVPRDNNPSLRFGSEFTRIFSENFSGSLRGAGYQLAKSGDGASVAGLGGGIGLSAGMGMTWRFLSFDFAWKPFKELGDTYRYSVKLRF